jgi:hypothetical protein
MPTASSLRRSLRAGALLPAMVFFSSCSETYPVSPAEEPEFVRKSLRGKLALVISDKATLITRGRSMGVVEISVRALCPKGYQRHEAGPFMLTQGLANGVGSIQLQLGGCSGHWESGKLRVFSTSETPFQRGPALVQVTFAVVNSNDPTEEDVLSTAVEKQVMIR